MNIYDYADVLNLELEILYYPNQKRRFTASFKRAEVMQKGFLAGTYGNGKTPDLAINDYVEQIKGKRIAINAMSKDRMEYDVPERLTSEVPF